METALFSPSSLFHLHDDDDDDDDDHQQQQRGGDEGGGESAVEGNSGSDDCEEAFLERTHVFPGPTELVIREFSFHEYNANLLWPGTFAFSEWLLHHSSLFRGRRVLELGSGTGALAIFLQKSFGVDITTSDFDDKEIEENIAHNCRANALSVLPHIRHSWGDTFPICDPDWEMIIASDILLYVKQYPNLIKTLSFLLKSFKQKNNKAGFVSSLVTNSITIPGFQGKELHLSLPVFIMSWRRRIGKEKEALFFDGCRDAGLVTEHLGSRVYCISAGR